MIYTADTLGELVESYPAIVTKSEVNISQYLLWQSAMRSCH